MIKNINNLSRIKLIVGSIVLLLYMFIILWFSDALFPYIYMLLGFPIFIIPILYICMFIRSIRLIKEKNNILNWIPLFILIFIIIVYMFFNPLYLNKVYNYKKNYEKRNNIVNTIIKEENKNKEKNILYLETQNYNVSFNGEIYIYKNTENERLIEFCITLPFPNGGYSLFYSSSNETLIKKNINYISDIKKWIKTGILFILNEKLC